MTSNYQSAESIPAEICAVTGVSLDPADGWSLDVAALIAATRPNTKLISIRFPNNPTGKILERDRFDALIGFCRDRGIWLFSDEVYRLIERDQALRSPAAVDAYERGISLGGLSKPYGLPGLRVGWIACRDEGALRLFDRARSYLSICGAGPSEVLAQIALKSGDRLLARNRRIAAQNLTLLTGFSPSATIFRLAPARWRGRRLPRYRHTEGVEAFCRRLTRSMASCCSRRVFTDRNYCRRRRTGFASASAARISPPETMRWERRSTPVEQEPNASFDQCAWPLAGACAVHRSDDSAFGGS